MKKISSGRIGLMLVGGAYVFKRATNLITPIFLVRILDMEQYGEYRLFWLIASTIMLFAPLGIDRSLLYFLPRSDIERQKLFVSQSILLLSITGLVFGLFVSPWNPLFYRAAPEFQSFGYFISGFAVLWVVSSLVEVLPSANQDYKWQVKAIAWLTIARNILVVMVAYLFGDLVYIYASLVFFAFIKTIVLSSYCIRTYGSRFFRIDLNLWKEQLKFSVPFSFASMLSGMQGKFEHWIVALIFPLSSFAVFSIVKNVVALISILRRSMGQVLMPKMSKSDSKGDEKRSLLLNSRANLASSFIVFPIISYLMIFGEPVIRLVYTDSYVSAVPVMRIYLFSMALSAVSVGNLLMIYKQKKFVVYVSFFVLLFSGSLSYIGGILFGLEGIAFGSLAGMIVDKAIRFRRIAKVLGSTVSAIQDWKTISIYLLASIIAACLSIFIFNILLIQPSTLDLFLCSILYLLLYILIIFLAGKELMIYIILGKKSWPTQ